MDIIEHNSALFRTISAHNSIERSSFNCTSQLVIISVIIKQLAVTTPANCNIKLLTRQSIRVLTAQQIQNQLATKLSVTIPTQSLINCVHKRRMFNRKTSKNLLTVQNIGIMPLDRKSVV